MGVHYVEVCQYGYTHGQCRCIGDKVERRIMCPSPDKHVVTYEPKHRRD